MGTLPDNETLVSALDRLEEAGQGLMGLGIPRCPASSLLESSLEELAGELPAAAVAMVTLASREDWAAREDFLWPRGIRVSRASVPVVARLCDGQWSTRQGAAPAAVLTAWLAGDAPTEGDAPLRRAEQQAIADSAARRAQHAAARGRGVGRGAE